MQVEATQAFQPASSEAVRRPLVHHFVERCRQILADGGTIDPSILQNGPPDSAGAARRPGRADANDRMHPIDGAARPDRPVANDRANRPDARRVAERLEGVMISTVVGRMREASGVHLFGEGPGAQVHEGLFDQMMGDALAANQGVGLYREVEASIRRHQESNPNDTGVDLAPVTNHPSLPLRGLRFQ